MSNVNARSARLINSQIKNSKVLVVGCGTVGSKVAHALASIGVRKFDLYDDDTVDIVNIPSQGYKNEDIGNGKASTLMSQLTDRFPDVEGSARREKFQLHTLYGQDGEKHSYRIVVSAADSMRARSQVFRAFKGLGVILVDSRCHGHEVQTYAVNLSDELAVEQYEGTLYSDEEAERPVCGGEMFPLAGDAAAIASIAGIQGCFDEEHDWMFRVSHTNLGTIN